MMAQEAALKELANRRLRRLLASSKSVTCADVKIGEAALSCKAQSMRSAPRRRRPALILDVDGTDVTAKVRPQTCMMARFRIRKIGDEGDVKDAVLRPCVNVSDVLVRIWGVRRGKWAWRRIWMWTGKMGIFLEYRHAGE